MRIYIVRHGQSVSNTKDLIQDGSDPLSDEGVKQTIFLGQRFKTLPVDTIFSSDFERAYKTAEQISLNTGKEIQILKELREHKKPSGLVGKHHEDPAVLEFNQAFKENLNDPAWHYSDEENYFDLQKRVMKVLEMLENRKDENTVLVTHGLVVRMIMALVLITPEFLTPEIFHKLRHNLKTKNTGITIIESKPKGGYRLTVFNDIAHLGE